MRFTEKAVMENDKITIILMKRKRRLELWEQLLQLEQVSQY